LDSFELRSKNGKNEKGILQTYVNLRNETTFDQMTIFIEVPKEQKPI